jgi:type II secretory pathway component GspD/PulD (secretin)
LPLFRLVSLVTIPLMFLSEISRRLAQILPRPAAIGRVPAAILMAISLVLAPISLPAQTSGAQTAAPSVPAPKDARQVYQEGQRAEASGDWEMAFQDYQHAAALAPNDPAIQIRERFARAALAQQRTEQAERQLVSGNPAVARALLQSALQVDPSYTVAQERLQELAESSNSSFLSGETSASAVPEIKPKSGTRNFDYNGPTRGAYEEIAREFGVVAAFDPELPDRQIRFRVSDIDFDTAMRLLSEQTGTFWFAVDAKTFFVAADTPAKRRDYDPEVKKTILLPAAETNDEMTEAMRMVRDIVGLRRTELDFKTHTITIRDTPANVALAEAILKDVQQTPGEFLLEIDLLEVDRQSLLDLGISPPTSASTFSVPTGVIRELQQAQSSGTLLQALQTIFGTQNPLAASTAAAAAIPPLIAFGGGNTIFLATLPGASANFARTLSMTRSAQRVLLRVEDGRPATFFVGEHFPITLALLSASLVAPSSQLSSSAITGNFTGAFPRTDFPVGHSPTSIAVADFNGDGKLDLAVTNEGDNTVSILLGNGDGTFQSPTSVATRVAPDAIVTADFNADGKADLAVANVSDNTISILLGNGDGTFTAGTTITGIKSPVAMVTGDFRNIGRADLAVLDQADGLVSVLLGNGDGTFANPIDTTVGMTPSALVTGDFNGDGKLDVAVTNSGSNTVSVLLGNGDGTFFQRIDFGTGVGPSAIASADYNGDGRLDLAVTNKIDNTLSIFLGNGDGTFGAATNFSTDGGPTALVSGNFGGTFPSLIVVCESANTIDLFLGLGNDSFATPVSIPTGNNPVAIADGDFVGNGLLDVAVANNASATVSVFLNPVNSQQSSSAPLTSYPGSEYVDLGLKVHATPRVHPDGEVSLNMQFEITALSGQNVNGIPIIGNRAIEQMVRLRANETSLLSGLIESSEIRSITGWPGLTALGPLTGEHNNQQSDTELVIAITPRQLRLTPRQDRTFYAGRGVGTVAPPEIPAQAPLPPQPVGVPAPGARPAPGALAPGALPAPGAPGVPPAAAPETPAPNAVAAPPNPLAPVSQQPNGPQDTPPQTQTPDRER